MPQHPNDANHQGTIKDAMAMASQIAIIYKQLLDITVGDKPIGCVYAGDGIYVGVLTDTEPYRAAFYDFTVSSSPFLVIGEKTYDPRMEGCDINYFYPILVEAVFAFMELRVQREREQKLTPETYWDWASSSRVWIGMHHVWNYFNTDGDDEVNRASIDNYFSKEVQHKITWEWDDATKIVTAKCDPVMLDGEMQSLTFSYNGTILSAIGKEWGVHLNGQHTPFCKAFARIPFMAGWQRKS